ncbi:MAG: hypothetical protein AB1696_12615 [Planctomycetota bacterium]
MLLFRPAWIVSEDWVRERIVATLREKAHREVEIGRIELSRLGRVKISDVVFKSGEGRLPMMRADSFTLYVKLLPLFRGQVVIQRLRLREPSFCLTAADLETLSAGGRGADPEKIMARLAVEDLSIQNADVVVLNADGRPAFSVFGFDMAAQGVQGEPLEYTMSFRLDAAGISGKAHAAGRLTAFREAGHALHIRELVFESLPLRAAVAGKAASEDHRIHLAVGMDVEGDLDALRKFLAGLAIPIPADLEIHGKSKMRLNLTGPLSDVTVEGAIDVPPEAVTYNEKRLMRWEGKDDLTFLVHRGKDALDLRSVKVRSSLGETVVTGQIRGPEDNPTLDLRIHTTADVAEFLKAAPGAPAAAATGQVVSKLHVSGPTTNLKIAGEVDLSAVEVKNGEDVLKKTGEDSRITLDLALHDGMAAVGENTTLQTPVGTLRAKGTLRLPLDTPILDLAVSGNADAAALWARLPASWRKALAKWSATGAATMEARIEGTPSDFNLSGALDLNTVVVNHNGKTIRKPDTPVQANVDLRLTESEAILNSVTMSTDSASVRMQGKILNMRDNPRADLALDVRGDLDKLVPAARAHGLELLPETVSLRGPIRMTGSAKESPDGVFRVHSKLHIADSEWRHRGVVLKPRHYEPEICLDCSLREGRFAVERFLYRSEAVEISGTGGTEDGSRLAMDLQSRTNMDRLQSIIEAELRQAMSQVDMKNLPPEMADLAKGLPHDLRASGTMTATLRFSADLDDVEATGSVDTADVGINYRQVPLKKRAEPLRLAFRAQAERGSPVRAGVTLESDAGRTDVNGRIVVGETPDLDLLVESELDTGRWLANLPVEDVVADRALGALLDREGIDLRVIRDNLRASGAAKMRFNVTGSPRAPRIAGGIDASAVALSVVTHKDKTLLHKAAGKRAMADLHVGVWGDEFVIHSARLEHGSDVYAAEGDIAVSKGRLVARKVRLRANDRQAEAELDATLSESSVGIERLTIRHEKDCWDLSGRIDYTEDRIAADDFRFRINDSKTLVDFEVKDYTEPSPEISLLILSPRLDARPLVPAITLSPIKPYPAEERHKVELALVPERLPEKLARFLRNARIEGKVVIGTFVLDVDDQQDRNPAIRRYEIRNVSSHAHLRDGIFALTLKGILNEGMLDFEWNADLNADLPASTLSYWTDRIQAHDNLRPLMNYTFNNLYVEGELGFDGRGSWQGLTAYNMVRSMQGKTKMYIDNGFLLGKAAPEYMLGIFPWLNLHRATWNFKRADIISVTEGPVATNTMRFRYPGSTYMSGQTNNITKEIRYVFGVDLVDSFGLGESTGIIPDRIESKSSIDICRYVGTLDNQEVEWFKLRGDEVVSLLKRLLQIQTFANLFSPKKTPIEKAEYLEGRAVGIITVPARMGRSLLDTPHRVIEEREVKEIDRMKD